MWISWLKLCVTAPGYCYHVVARYSGFDLSKNTAQQQYKQILEFGMHLEYKKGNRKNTASEILMLLAVIVNYY